MFPRSRLAVVAFLSQSVIIDLLFRGAEATTGPNTASLFSGTKYCCLDEHLLQNALISEQHQCLGRSI